MRILMAKKRKEENVSVVSNSNAESSVACSNEFGLTSDNQWLLDLLNSDLAARHNYNTSCATTSHGFDDILCTRRSMDQQQTSGVEKFSSELQAAQASVITSSTTVAPGLFSSFPDKWFETDNTDFVNNDFLPYTQRVAPFPSVATAASDEQMTSSWPSAISDEKQINKTGQLPFVKSPPADEIYQTIASGTIRSPGTNQNLLHMSHASTSMQSPEVLTKPKKKRLSETKSIELLSDSDSDVSDDVTLSENEDDGDSGVNSQQFALTFLDLCTKGKPCSFWQYNSQSRGPKGRRLYGEITLKDCHVLDEFTDPVTQNTRSTSKLRHGEGNDPRPDTHKLIEIGAQISQLEDKFKAITATKTSSKEDASRQKNKLASRICRLKKKAQHEANKVKLEGLREEHERLVAVAAKLVTMMESRFISLGPEKHLHDSLQPSLCSQLEALINSHLKFMIAGHTSEYVNTQIEKAARENAANRQST